MTTRLSARFAWIAVGLSLAGAGVARVDVPPVRQAGVTAETSDILRATGNEGEAQTAAAPSAASGQEQSPQLPCLEPLGVPADLKSLSTLVSKGPTEPSREGRTESQFYVEYDQEIERWFCALDALTAIQDPSVDDTLATLWDHPTFRLAIARRLADRGSQLGIDVLTAAASLEADCARVEEAALWFLSHQRPDGVRGYFRMLELPDSRCVRWVEQAPGLATVAAGMPDFNYVAEVLDLRTLWPDRFERIGVGLLERGARVPRWHDASCAALRRLAAEPPSKLGESAASVAEKYCAPNPDKELGAPGSGRPPLGRQLVAHPKQAGLLRPSAQSCGGRY